MIVDDEPSAADRPEHVADPVREADLERVMKDVPRGALAISTLAVIVLLPGLPSTSASTSRVVP